MSATSSEFAARAAAAAPLLVLTGAGISTGSGIPTYRDERGRWLRSDPITHQEFIDDARQRQRYWGRSTLGWPAISSARPTPAHDGLTALERDDMLHWVVTQNVDRLHQRAGTTRVIDLHGRLDRVHCLDCGRFSERSALQARLINLNPGLQRAVSPARPDGDADLAEDEIDSVRVPACVDCGGTLMPDVVFFGGSIPGERVSHSREALHACRGLLVIGSSLQVYSGYRFCRWAKELGIPLFIANPGETRADAMADHRLHLPADAVVTALRQAWSAREATPA